MQLTFCRVVDKDMFEGSYSERWHDPQRVLPWSMEDPTGLDIHVVDVQAKSVVT